MAILFLLAVLTLTAIIMMLTGLIMLFSSNSETSTKGGKYLLYGFLLLLVEVLVGFAVCSSMNFSIH